jgi:hypothetical protein
LMLYSAIIKAGGLTYPLSTRFGGRGLG